jgi:hypothetical protein
VDILNTIINAQDGAAVRQLGAQLGLGEEQTASALSALVPVLAAGFQRNLQSEGGLAGLVSALSAGHHQQYIENPATLRDQAAVAEGNGILRHVLGSKDVSREVASRAADRTGVSADLMKQLLPLAATLMMGAFARNADAATSTPAGPAGAEGGIADMLGPLLDRNRDGSILDDMAGMAGRFFNRS